MAWDKLFSRKWLSFILVTVLVIMNRKIGLGLTNDDVTFILIGSGLFSITEGTVDVMTAVKAAATVAPVTGQKK